MANMRDTFHQKLKKKSDTILLLLIEGIVTLCIGFLISNCGSGPATKIFVDAGNYAIDFSTDPPSPGVIGYVSASLSVSDMTNMDFTIEAWVKPALTNASGTIWSRAGYVGGIVTHLNINNVPCITTASSTGWPTWTTYQSCASGSPLTAGQWSHVAFVMCNSNLGCNDGHATTSPHFDVYVNGVWVASAGAGNTRAWNVEISPGTPGAPLNEWIGRKQYTFTGIDGGYTRIRAVIDDVRFWRVARTRSQIQECMYRELGASGGNCSVGGTDLIGYWKFNEGRGNDACDSSGTGNNGELTWCYGGVACWVSVPWDEPNCWVPGYQF